MNIASILSASSPKLPFTSSQPYLFCALYRGRGELARVGMSHSCIFCVTGRSTRCANRERILLGPSVTHRCNKDRHRSPTSLRWPSEREIRRVGFTTALPSQSKPNSPLRGFSSSPSPNFENETETILGIGDCG